MTVLTTTQPIPYIIAVMPSLQHPMVPCNTHSVFFPCSRSFFHSKPASRQPIVTGTSVLAIKYKDGIMMAADNLGLVFFFFCRAMYTNYLFNFSIIWLSCTLQRCAAPTSRWRLYSRRCEWRSVRLSVSSAYPRRTCYLRGIQFTRWAYTWPR